MRPLPLALRVLESSVYVGGKLVSDDAADLRRAFERAPGGEGRARLTLLPESSSNTAARVLAAAAESGIEEVEIALGDESVSLNLAAPGQLQGPSVALTPGAEAVEDSLEEHCAQGCTVDVRVQATTGLDQLFSLVVSLQRWQARWPGLVVTFTAR